MKKVNPKLRLRVAGRGDVVGLFAGKFGKQGYICRLTKGELQLNGFKTRVHYGSALHPKTYTRISKRGRETVVNLLRSYGWVTNHRDRTMLISGIEHDKQTKRNKRGGTSHG